MSNLQRIVNSLVYPYQSKISPAMLTADVGAHQRTNAGGIDIRDLAEINNQCLGLIRSDGCLELEYRGQYQGAGKFQYPLSRLRSNSIFNT